MNVKMKPLPKVRCPNCKKTGNWLKGPYAPFCSQRCKLIDLGKWLSEEHRIEEPLRPEHFASYEDLPAGEHLDRTDTDEKS